MNTIKCEIVFDDFPIICRVCLYKGDTKPFTQPLQLLFRSFVNINIADEDELPKNICSKCACQLKEFGDFVDCAVVSNKHLKDVLVKHRDKLNLEYFDNNTKFEISEENSVDYEDFNNDNDSLHDIKEEDFLSDHKIKKDEPIIKHQFHCKACKNIFISVKDLCEHRKQNRNCSFKCESCDEYFVYYKELCSHRKKNEKCKNQKHTCNLCGKVFRHRHLLKRHSRAHTSETPFQCTLCGKRFKFPQNLRRHTIGHKGVKPFKCDICGKDFGQRVTLKTHISRKHGVNTNVSEYRIFKCKEVLTSKRKFESKVTTNNLPKKYDPVKCDVCYQNFQNIYTLNAHKIIHYDSKKFLCPICGKIFLRKLSLIQHSRVHTGEKPYKCQHCKKQFSQASGYKRHLVIHTGERPYSCEICQKNFKQAAHLSSHLKGHNNDKPFECNFCKKAFSFKRSWIVHQRIHTGEKPYSCITCDKQFCDKSGLNKHNKVHLKT